MFCCQVSETLNPSLSDSCLVLVVSQAEVEKSIFVRLNSS
jgi:hypothetical protein